VPETVPESVSETIDLLNNRVSVRKFKNDPVPEDLIEQVLQAAFRAPTSSNIQSYSVVIVQDPEIREKLAVVAGNQKHVITAPVFLAFCADLTRIEHAMSKHGHTLADNNMEIGLVSSIDASLVGMSVYLAAESVGLKGVMIGAVRNDAVETARLLGLPPQVYCVFGMCLGWADEAPAQKPRMDYSSMVHYDRFGGLRDNRDMAQSLDDYDANLEKHYTAKGIATTPDSWTHDMDKKFSPQLRDNLRQQLKELGFDFR
jgi:nitroreductase